MRRDRVLRLAALERFVVSLHDGSAFNGLLERLDESTLVLVDVTYIERNGTTTRIDGRIYVPRANVAYLQRA